LRMDPDVPRGTRSGPRRRGRMTGAEQAEHAGGNGVGAAHHCVTGGVVSSPRQART
jgi:hypothetical protein